MANFRIKLLTLDKEFLADSIAHDKDDNTAIFFMDVTTKQGIKTNDIYVITSLRENEENDKE